MNVAILKQIKNLFISYQQAFKRYDIKAVEACYQIPCTLTTPDDFILVNNKLEFTEQLLKFLGNYNRQKLTRVLLTMPVIS